MAIRLEDLSDRLERRADQIDDGLTRVARGVGTFVLTTAAEETPVNTGRARSNWVVSLRAPSRETRGPFAPGMRLGIRETANLQAVVQAGQTVINSFQARENSSLWITNNVSYIVELNRGSSPQQPLGITPVVISRFRSEFGRGRFRIFED